MSGISSTPLQPEYTSFSRTSSSTSIADSVPTTPGKSTDTKAIKENLKALENGAGSFLKGFTKVILGLAATTVFTGALIANFGAEAACFLATGAVLATVDLLAVIVVYGILNPFLCAPPISLEDTLKAGATVSAALCFIPLGLSLCLRVPLAVIAASAKEMGSRTAMKLPDGLNDELDALIQLSLADLNALRGTGSSQ